MVASGRYGDESEVVRDGLRLLAERDSDLAARREDLFRSFDDARDDVLKNGGHSAEDVRAYLGARQAQRAKAV